MGRGRGKSKKQNVIAMREEDPGSDEEERIPPTRRRGRPHKQLKDDIGEGEEAQKIEDNEDPNSYVSSEVLKNQSVIENGMKRKRSSQVNEIIKSAKEDLSVETKSNLDDSTKQSGSRRKNKPRRAAEAGVQCK